MKTLIEIHVIQNFAPSNLNRDDTGAPKDALFGGTRRARISSQCQKRTIRQFFNSIVGKGLLLQEDFAIRTKRLLRAIVLLLIDQGRSEQEAITKTRLALAAVGLPVKEDGKNEYLLFLGQRETRDIARIIHEKWDLIAESPAEPDTPSETTKKRRKTKEDAVKSADPELKNAFMTVINGGKAVDIALFGRMLADMPEKNQDAACQVAHAISTHTVDREFDYFTAIDDLKPDDNAGADMINTVEFNSACFYKYAVVDLNKLVENLHGDKDLALKGLRVFLEGFVVAEPTGKQNSFAAHNPPEFVAVSVRCEAAPRSFTNAFEVAIRTRKEESLTGKSVEALVKKAVMLKTAFEGDDKNTFVLNLTEVDARGLGSYVKSLKELLDAVIKVVRE